MKTKILFTHVVKFFSDTFDIGQFSGDLRLRKQPEAGKNLFEFNVKVTDRSGLTASVNVKVYFSCK